MGRSQQGTKIDRQPRSAMLWRPRRGMRVRVAIGRGLGAHGVVQGKRYRWGHETVLVEIDTDSPKMPGQWLDVAWWRLAPVRRTSRQRRTATARTQPEGVAGNFDAAMSRPAPFGPTAGGSASETPEVRQSRARATSA